MSDQNYQGVLFIGDPHLASRVVGFRKDDYGRAILSKLHWCLSQAALHRLLPVVLGDLFHHPRDNANWLMGEILALFSRYEVFGVYGNHDCREDVLGEDDSLDVLVRAGHYRLLSIESPWRGHIAGRNVAIFGVPWRQRIPICFPRAADDDLCILVSHHDVNMPGYDQSGHFRPFEIEGIDLVVNGHIHRQLYEENAGTTTWVNPGNISRVARSEAFRGFIPTVLRLDLEGGEWHRTAVPVPHQSFDEVFHEAVVDYEADTIQSEFVRGLAELQARRTESGAGLREFLSLNLDQFDADVQEEIQSLAGEVLIDEVVAAGAQQ